MKQLLSFQEVNLVTFKPVLSLKGSKKTDALWQRPLQEYDSIQLQLTSFSCHFIKHEHNS